MPNVNTLTIYLNTTIPANPKLRYDPSMSIPKVFSHVVYFDPLIQYSKEAVDLPDNENERKMQFFDAGLFETLVNRSISGFNLKRKDKLVKNYKNYKNAIKKGYIDNNISTTLKTLFKKRDILNIKQDKFTVVTYEWDMGNWTLDSKPPDIDKKIDYSEFKKYEERTEQFVSSIPEDIRFGTMSQFIASPFEQVDNKPEEMKTEEININYKIHLVHPINFSTNPDFNCDPITISLFITLDFLTNKLSKNSLKIDIVDFYNKFMQSKKNVYDLIDAKNKIESNINKSTEDFHELCKEFYNKINGKISNNNDLLKIMKEFHELDIQIRKFVIELNNINLKIIFESIPLYFKTTYNFIEKLEFIYKKDYQNEDIFGFYEMSYLILECINFDKELYSSLYKLFELFNKTKNDITIPDINSIFTNNTIINNKSNKYYGYYILLKYIYEKSNEFKNKPYYGLKVLKSIRHAKF
jgi:hypothetical protein